MGARKQVLFSSTRGYRIPRDEVDPRSWQLVGQPPGPIGVIVDLIVDEGELKVTHLVCELSGHPDRRLALPAGLGRLDPTNLHVIFDTLTADELDAIPAFEGLPIAAEAEHLTLCALTGRNPSAPQEPPRSADRRQGDRRAS